MLLNLDWGPDEPDTLGYVPGEVLLALRTKDNLTDLNAFVAQQSWPDHLGNLMREHFQIDYRYVNADGDHLAVGCLEDLPDSLLEPQLTHELASLLHVEWAEPNYVFEVLPQGDATSGTDNSVAWHLQKMMVPQAWEIWQETSNVILAVLDDGIDYNHVALRDNIWLNPGEIPGDGQDNDGNGFIDDIRGWDFFDITSDECEGGDADPSPETGSQHGTMVAVVAAGRLDTSTGLGGVAGYTKILPLRVTGLDPTSTKHTTRALHWQGNRLRAQCERQR